MYVLCGCVCTVCMCASACVRARACIAAQIFYKSISYFKIPAVTRVK